MNTTSSPGKKERAGEVAAACVYHGMYEKAQQILSRFGQSGCDKEALLMLVKERIAGEKRRLCATGSSVVPHSVSGTVHGRRCASLPDEILYGVNERTDCFIRKCMSVPGLVLDDGCKERLLGQVLFTDTDPSYYEPLFHEYYEKGKTEYWLRHFCPIMPMNIWWTASICRRRWQKRSKKEAMYVKRRCDGICLAESHVRGKTP